MKERPILFSAPMVRAILEGRKTVTRREVKLPRARDSFVLIDHGNGWWPYQSDDGENELCADGNEHPYTCPYGQPGDRLWVREAWRKIESAPVGWDEQGESEIDYRATPRGQLGGCGERWRPSIHMHRWASRILLEVTDVRVERLQGINEEQALAEGIDLDQLADAQGRYDMVADHNFTGRPTAAEAFRHLWESINGADSWEENPWVWVVEFKRIKL